MIRIVPGSTRPAKPSLAIVLVYEGAALEKAPYGDAALATHAKADGFKGEKEKSFYLPGNPRRLVLGLGAEKTADLEAYRRAGLTAARRARELKVEEAVLSFPASAKKEQAGAAAEGAWLGLYQYKEGKGKPAADAKPGV